MGGKPHDAMARRDPRQVHGTQFLRDRLWHGREPDAQRSEERCAADEESEDPRIQNGPSTFETHTGGSRSMVDESARAKRASNRRARSVSANCHNSLLSRSSRRAKRHRHCHGDFRAVPRVLAGDSGSRQEHLPAPRARLLRDVSWLGDGSAIRLPRDAEHDGRTHRWLHGALLGYDSREQQRRYRENQQQSVRRRGGRTIRKSAMSALDLRRRMQHALAVPLRNLGRVSSQSLLLAAVREALPPATAFRRHQHRDLWRPVAVAASQKQCYLWKSVQERIRFLGAEYVQNVLAQRQRQRAANLLSDEIFADGRPVARSGVESLQIRKRVLGNVLLRPWLAYEEHRHVASRCCSSSLRAAQLPAACSKNVATRLECRSLVEY